jgi:hypothetical protein
MLIDQMHYEFDLLYDRVASNDRPDFRAWEKDAFLNQAIDIFVKTRYNFDKFVLQGKTGQEIGFESNQFRIDELASLHIKSPEVQPEITPINVADDVYEFTLNSLGNNISGQYFRYMFATKIRVKITDGKCIKYVDAYNFQIDDRKTSFNASSWKWNRATCNFGKSSTIVASIPNTNQFSPDYSINLSTGSTTAQTSLNDVLKSFYIDSKDRCRKPAYTVLGAQVSYIKRPNRVCLGNYSHIDKHTSNVAIHCDIDDAFHREIVNIAVSLATQSIQDQMNASYADKNVKEDFMS